MTTKRDTGQSEDLTLSVHPSVVFRLGEEMIQDDVQALVELAKNAYDADSPSARISVDTDASALPIAGLTEPLLGTISVEDRGLGMTRDEIVQSWLTVSGSQKRELKRQGGTTGKKRTPVGDKGLGRLGTQRLGTVLELYTVVKGSGAAHRLTMNWDDYTTADRLDSVRFQLVTEPAPQKAHGTTLTIYGLHDLSRWRGAAVPELARRLSAMISPFGNRGFEVSLNVDGQPVDLLERPEAVRENAMVRYELKYQRGVLSVAGSVTQDYFRPDRGGADKRAAYERAFGFDDGASFLRWLLANRKDQAESLGLRKDSKRYIAFGGRFEIRSMDGVPWDGDQPVDPGPFSGEIDMVRLRDDIPSVFDSSKDYSNFIKEINGIRIYRDGFGIPISKDWLDLASRWTSGSSFYNLRPENIIGFVDISAAGNPDLEETSSREQFRDTPAYRSFLTIMERWRRFTETAQTFLRRSYNDYLLEISSAPGSNSAGSSPTTLIEQAERHEAQAADLVEQLDNARNAAASALETAEDQERGISETLFPDGRAQIQKAAEQLRGLLTTLEDLAKKVAELRANYRQQRDALIVLGEQFDAVQAQLSEAWSTVALGLTAEALSHEVGHVTDRLRQRTQALLRGLKSPVNEVSVRTYAEHVLSSTTALTRQLAHLNPALRYRRESRQRVVMSTALADIANHFNQRWADLGYPIEMKVSVKRDFAVRISPGRLTQVLDNLILNSEYWVLNHSKSSSGSIQVSIDFATLTISDSGPGIEPNLEGLIFDPFVSGKSKDGRGLGLFVVRQLLEPEKATIELSGSRGADGRRRTFVVAFDNSGSEAIK